MSLSTLQPVKGKPGYFLNTITGKYTFIAEWREDNKYDTVKITGATALTAGTERNFFRDLTDKEYIHTNLTTPRRLPAGEEMLVDRAWVYMPSAIGNTVTLGTDFKKVVEGAYIKFQINRKDVAEGPMWMFPSGYGLAGNTSENNAALLSIGVPSTAAAAKLKREQYLTSEHDMDAVLSFKSQAGWDTNFAMATLTQHIQIKAGYHGTVRSAATK